MAIDINALGAFRSAANWNREAVANLDGDGIASHGLYEGKLKAAFSTRAQDVKDANNAVRTALLKALGNACGLDHGEGDRFSDDFMDRLQQLIGKDFKRDDFGIDSNGQVKSGRPLTARRINAILARVDAAKSQAVVDEAINYIQGHGKLGKRAATTFPLTKSERKLAVDLVAQHGAELSDATRGVLARFVVNAISRKKYEYGPATVRKQVGEIARQTAQALSGVKTYEDKPTELFRARLNEKMEHDGDYGGQSVFKGFMTNGDDTRYMVQGEVCEKRVPAIAQLKTYIRNPNHRKAITTVMSQQFRSLVGKAGDALENELVKEHDAEISVDEADDVEISVNKADDVPENGLLRERDAEVKLAVEGKKATVTVKCKLDFRFNIDNANEWADLPMGTCNRETKFEFDLSDEKEAVLTSVNFKQTI